MSILKPRNRLVNFRLTEEEFVLLRDACMAQGARSISDFARSAVLRQADRSSAPRPAADFDMPSTQSLAELTSMMLQLQDRVGQLVQQVDAVAPSTNEQVA